MKNKCKASVLASLIGDALSLGVHWEYDPEHIMRTHGRVNTYLEPESGSYHSGKKAGDLTHIGDQTLVLLNSVSQNGGFSLEDFAGRWQKLFKSYSGYLDKATRKTLEHFSQGSDPAAAGSDSMELAGAVRIAPLICALKYDPGALFRAVREQTIMTHNHPAPLAAAHFLGRTVLNVLQGLEPVPAMQEAANEDYGAAPVAQWVRMGLDTVDKKTVTAITRLGQACGTANALSGAVHLIAKYSDDLSTCLVECVMAGGDSASRAMAAGMVLGAYLGTEYIPEMWINGLRAKDRIMQSLEAL